MDASIYNINKLRQVDLNHLSPKRMGRTTCTAVYTVASDSPILMHLSLDSLQRDMFYMF